MKRTLIVLLFGCILQTLSLPTSALTDTYYATGEDLDYLIESDNTEALQEIEYELRKFVLFRKVEDFIYSVTETYFDGED